MDDPVVTRAAHGSQPQYARIERAFERIEREWLPVNRAHLNQIAAAFRAGAYDIDPERVITELCADIGAVTWLIHRAISEGVRGGTPLQILSALPVSRLIEFLEEKSVPAHNLASSSAEQLAMLRSSVVAVGSAYGLAQSSQVDPSEAIGAELLLHLGRLLIAWNYPLAFGRASRADPSISIDERLSGEIGFSPLLLSNYLALKWKLDEKFTRITSVEPLLGAEEASLAKIIEISEAFAAAEIPEYFPDAAERFERASTVVRESLGSVGLTRIEEEISKIAAPYETVLKRKFSEDTNLSLGRRLELLRSTNGGVGAERLISSIRLNVRPEFRRLLAEAAQQSTVNVAVAKSCMEDLAPLCGFSAGCIYVYDPFTRVFRQRLKVGSWHREMPMVVNELAAGDIPNQLAAAFKADQIHISNGDTLSVPSLLISPLGSRNRIGVLCYEAQLLSVEDSGPALSHTRALRTLLESALKT